MSSFSAQCLLGGPLDSGKFVNALLVCEPEREQIRLAVLSSSSRDCNQGTLGRSRKLAVLMAQLFAPSGNGTAAE